MQGYKIFFCFLISSFVLILVPAHANCLKKLGAIRAEENANALNGVEASDTGDFNGACPPFRGIWDYSSPGHAFGMNGFQKGCVTTTSNEKSGPKVPDYRVEKLLSQAESMRLRHKPFSTFAKSIQTEFPSADLTAISNFVRAGNENNSFCTDSEYLSEDVIREQVISALKSGKPPAGL